MARTIGSSAAHVVQVTTVLVVLLSLLVDTTVSVSASATASPSQQQQQPQRISPDHQTSVLNRLWWRNLEEQDAFIHTLFRKPLATANIGVFTSSTASEDAAIAAAAASVNATESTEARLVPQLLQQPQQRRGRQGISRGRGCSTAHHALANTAGPEKRLFTPKLHLVYTITEERKRALEQEAAAATAAAAADTAPSTAAAFGASYRQMLRAVLPIGLGGPVEAEAGAPVQRPPTPLQTASLASPIAPLRFHVIETSTERNMQENMDASRKAVSSPGAVEPIVETAEDAAALKAQGQTGSSLSQAQSYAAETLVVVDSATKAVVPLTIVGTSYTVVQFDAKAGNTINAVVQLKDHRYDERVSTRNCFNMYLKVELRNHVKMGKDEAKDVSAQSSDDAAQGTTEPHAYIDKDQWSGLGGTSAKSAANDDEGEDISTAHRGSWATFWDSFALMFDTSALCKVLPSVSMRVSRAPQTEPFYVVLRSTTGYAYETAYRYNTTSGAFYANTRDDDYVCDLDLFIEQWPAAEQERRQLIFSFIVPLLVLLLPLPFTMRRADLVQQYMMDTDYAEWVWRPPYFLRNRMMDGLGMLVAWVQRTLCAYRQQLLRAQPLQRQQEDESTHLPPQSLLPPTLMSAPSGRPVDVKREERREETVQEAALPQHPPLPATTAASDAVPETREDAAEHRPCTPCGQFKDSLSAGSSQASDTSHYEYLSTGSARGLDADEPLDGRPRHTRLQQSLAPLRSSECSEHRGSVSPPHPVHSQYLPEGGATYARGGAAGPPAPSSSLQIGEPLGSSFAGEAGNNRRACCFHHHRYGTSSRDGAADAVSVHVPFTIDIPVLHSSHHPPHSRGSEAHDLLFTTAEGATSCGDERRDGLHARRSREEAEAHGLLRQQQPQQQQQDQPPVTAASEDAATTTSRTREAESKEEEEEEPFCRICREGSDVAPLITPCRCTGSVRFVHAACLDRWRLESAKRNLANVNNCEICKFPFTVNIQRSTLIWEGSQQFLRGFCLLLTCFCVVVLTTTLTHGILGELSCLASYHEVAYSTMFRFEGLSLSLFVYGLAVLLVLFANLIVYSWFRSRPEVEEYVAEVHAIPPFYTRYNLVLILLVCLLLLAQVHAMGFLLKYFFYKTSHLVWSWETSPLVGGILFAFFTTCSTTICSWGRQMYIVHVVNRWNGVNLAEDVVVEGEGGGAGGPPAAAPAPAAAPPSAGSISFPTSATLNYVNTGVGASPAPAVPQTTAPGLPSVPLQAGTLPSLVEPDATYSQHFAVPPEQRVIRAYEYCPPRRKVPK